MGDATAPVSITDTRQQGRRLSILFQPGPGSVWRSGEADIANLGDLVEAVVQSHALGETGEKTPGDNLAGAGAGWPKTMLVIAESIVPFQCSRASSVRTNKEKRQSRDIQQGVDSGLVLTVIDEVIDEDTQAVASRGGSELFNRTGKLDYFLKVSKVRVRQRLTDARSTRRPLHGDLPDNLSEGIGVLYVWQGNIILFTRGLAMLRGGAKRRHRRYPVDLSEFQCS